MSYCLIKHRDRFIEARDNLVQAAHYHILGLFKFGTSSLNLHLARYQSEEVKFENKVVPMLN
jgi:hypothetical protein